MLHSARLCPGQVVEAQDARLPALTTRGSSRGCGKEDRHFGVVDQKSRQRLDCVCLKYRFPFAATRQPSPHGSLCPEAKAPVKPGRTPNAGASNLSPDLSAFIRSPRNPVMNQEKGTGRASGPLQLSHPAAPTSSGDRISPRFRQPQAGKARWRRSRPTKSSDWRTPVRPLPARSR